MTITCGSRRLALVAAVIIGLSACGTSGEIATESTGASSSPPAPAIIKVAAGGQAAGQAMSTDAATSPAAAPLPEDARMMIAPLVYVYDGEAIDLTSPAASWFFAPGVTPTTEQVQTIAAAFGVSGDVREVPADMGGGWAVGSSDYTEPSINVGADATLSWWFNPGVSVQPASMPCAVASPELAADDTSSADVAVDPATGPATDPAIDLPTGSGSTGVATGVPVCETPAPPTNVPSADQAAAMTTDLLVALGLNPADYDFDTYADEWSASVTAYLRLDGMRTPMSISVGFGGDGAITWASGFLATPQRGGDYPRIGIDAGVQRLNETGGWMRGFAVDSRIEPLPAEAVPAVEPQTVDTPAAGVSTPAGEPAAVGAPTEAVTADEATTPDNTPLPIPETITVALSNPRASLEQLWAVDNTVWLLPGYLFDTSDGGQISVIAVEDQYLQVTAPIPTPAPVPVTDSTVVDPAPSSSDQTQPANPVAPPTECPAADRTTANVSAADASALVGLCVADAATVAKDSGFEVRVVRIDGVDQVVTADYSESRINLAVDAGIVTEVVSFG